MSLRELAPIRAADLAWQRRIADAMAHPSLRAAITRLDALVSAVPPADWEVTRYWGEDPTVYVVGAEDGEDFHEELEPVDGLAFLLDRAERRTPGLLDASQGSDDADLQLIAYYAYHQEDEPEIRAARGRVEKAWWRLVDRAATMEPHEREDVLGWAEEYAPKVGIDRGRAAAALRARRGR